MAPFADFDLELPHATPNVWWDTFYKNHLPVESAKRAETRSFLHLLQDMFLMDPNSRPSAADLMQHAWLTHCQDAGAIFPSAPSASNQV
jgi:serine/threonine protein kinase